MPRNPTPSSAARRRQERNPGFLFRQMVNNRNEEERRRRRRRNTVTDTTITADAAEEIERQHQGIYVLHISMLKLLAFTYYFYLVELQGKN